MNKDVLSKLFVPRNKNLIHLGSWTRPYIYDLQHGHGSNKYWHHDSSGEVGHEHNIQIGRYVKYDYDIVYQYLENTIKNHDFNELFVGFTSEGFSSFHNAKIISEIMDKHNLTSEKDKVILSTGNHYLPNYNIKSNGINMVPNFGIAEFNFKAFNTYYENNNTIMLHNVDRHLTKLFGAFYSRVTRGRLEIFNYFVDNHLFKDNLMVFASGILQFHRKMTAMGYDDELLKHENYTSIVNKQPNNEINYHSNILDDLKEQTRKIFVDIVVETVVYENNVEWITEKTCIPLIVGAPMVVLSHPGFYKMLHSLGFKTFSEFWPEDFDTIEDHDLRIKRFKEVLTYIRQNYDTVKKRREALNAMWSILVHNSNRMKELINYRPGHGTLENPTYRDCEFYDIVYNNRPNFNLNEIMLNKYI